MYISEMENVFLIGPSVFFMHMIIHQVHDNRFVIFLFETKSCFKFFKLNASSITKRYNVLQNAFDNVQH